jgi:muramidase (phage lysozyme)
MNREYYEGLLANPNMMAALNTIAQCELGEADKDKYNIVVGGDEVALTSSHPLVYNSELTSDAAGRYQFLSTTWEECIKGLGPLDFSNPRDQDLAAVYLISFIRGKEKEVISGDMVAALTGNGTEGDGLAYEWASLPPFRYKGQGVCSIEDIPRIFASYNGKGMPAGSTSPSSGSSLSNAAALTSGNSSYSAVRSDCPKNDYTQSFGKITTGCSMKAVAGFGTGVSLVASSPIGVPGAAGAASLLTVPSNLPKGMLPWPLRKSNSTPTGIYVSGFRTGGRPNHHGVDIGAYPTGPDRGEYCVAVLDGVVDFILPLSNGNGGGLVVYTKHAGDMNIAYMHLAESKVSVGQQVKPGMVIGVEGASGFGKQIAYDIHLHFQVMIGGQTSSHAIDPFPLIDQTGRISSDLSDDRF